MLNQLKDSISLLIIDMKKSSIQALDLPNTPGLNKRALGEQQQCDSESCSTRHFCFPSFLLYCWLFSLDNIYSASLLIPPDAHVPFRLPLSVLPAVLLRVVLPPCPAATGTPATVNAQGLAAVPPLSC